MLCEREREATAGTGKLTALAPPCALVIACCGRLVVVELLLVGMVDARHRRRRAGLDVGLGRARGRSIAYSAHRDGIRTGRWILLRV
jgi:hypothetical protein